MANQTSGLSQDDDFDVPVTSFDLLDIVRLPPVLLRARMLVRCLDQQDKRWLQSYCLLTEVSLVMLQPPQHSWKSVPLLHAQVRQDTGSQAEFFELSTAVKTYNFRAKHDRQAAEWVGLIGRVAMVHSDNAALSTAEFMGDDWREARYQEGVLAAAASVMQQDEVSHVSGRKDGGSGGGPVRLAPKAVLTLGTLQLDVPPWEALTAAARQYGVLSGDANRMALASRDSVRDAELMLLPGQAEVASLSMQMISREAEVVVDEEAADASSKKRAAVALLGVEAVQAARCRARRLMPDVLREAMRATSVSAPVVAAHALLLEAAAVAGADLGRLQRALALGNAAPRKPHRQLPSRTAESSSSALAMTAPAGAIGFGVPQPRLRKTTSTAAVFASAGSHRYGGADPAGLSRQRSVVRVVTMDGRGSITNEK